LSSDARRALAASVTDGDSREGRWKRSVETRLHARFKIARNGVITRPSRVARAHDDERGRRLRGAERHERCAFAALRRLRLSPSSALRTTDSGRRSRRARSRSPPLFSSRGRRTEIDLARPPPTPHPAGIVEPILSHLHRLKDLDDDATTLANGVRAAVDARLEDDRSGKRRRAVADAADASVRADAARCARIADEKVALAQRCYDLVDAHITRLDKDLRAFDAALATREAAEAAAAGIEAPTPSAPAVGGGGGGGADGGDAEAGAEAGGASVNDAPAVYGDGAPVDPNEPTYCVCKRVSFGEMIACENEDCVIEWFHFACVGLSSDATHKGKWYCETCKAELRKKKKEEEKKQKEKEKAKGGG
jgi:inhibitor of growth protein 4